VSTEAVDAVVIGAGHHGLVAAALLADAGWDVLVLEAQAERAVGDVEVQPATTRGLVEPACYTAINGRTMASSSTGWYGPGLGAGLPPGKASRTMVR
jgi:glycine/D-amino acid oxidase-like deaminating enzyme